MDQTTRPMDPADVVGAAREAARILRSIAESLSIVGDAILGDKSVRPDLYAAVKPALAVAMVQGFERAGQLMIGVLEAELVKPDDAAMPNAPGTGTVQ